MFSLISSLGVFLSKLQTPSLISKGVCKVIDVTSINLYAYWNNRKLPA
jgi:hypothetical protein